MARMLTNERTVNGDHVIAAVEVNQQPNDMPSFVPMMTAATAAAAGLHARTGSPEHQIGVVLADAGYCSIKNLEAPGADRIIALGKGRQQHLEAVQSPASGQPPAGATPREAMAHQLRTPEGSAAYKRRGATVNPASEPSRRSSADSPEEASSHRSPQRVEPRRRCRQHPENPH